MMCKLPLLSICIPTYNRADLLKNCVESIVTNYDFDEEVEVVISDNASDDNTLEVCEMFTSKYPNVKYYRNDHNIGGEANFIKVLELASGQFIKLYNDYNLLTKGGLHQFKEIIKSQQKSHGLIYFNNQTRAKMFGIKQIMNMDQLVNELGIEMTWISSFGFWAEDFVALPQKDRARDLQFQQTDWFLRMFQQKDGCIICCQHFINRQEMKTNFSYDFVKVQVVNYLQLFKPYLQSQKLSNKAYVNMLKKYPNWYWNVILQHVIRKPRWNISFKDSFKVIYPILGKYYWFYTLSFWYFFKKSFKGFK